MANDMSKIGIYAGTFDPVHLGHISFALNAQKQANLTKVYFLPERRPRYKTKVTPVQHRFEMLKIAITESPVLETVLLKEDYFTVEHTTLELQKLFPYYKLVYLLGSDVFKGMVKWPNLTQLIDKYEFVVSIRHDDENEIYKIAEELKITKITILNSKHPDASSSQIRHTISYGKGPNYCMQSVLSYAIKHKLYT